MLCACEWRQRKHWRFVCNKRTCRTTTTIPSTRTTDIRAYERTQCAHIPTQNATQSAWVLCYPISDPQYQPASQTPPLPQNTGHCTNARFYYIRSPCTRKRSVCVVMVHVFYNGEQVYCACTGCVLHFAIRLQMIFGFGNNLLTNQISVALFKTFVCG